MDTKKTKKPIYKKWWFWLLAVVVIVFLYSMFKPQEKLFLDVDNNTATLNRKVEAKFDFKTNAGNKYTVTDIATNQKIGTKKADSGNETLTLFDAGKYRLTVFLNGEKKSTTLTVKPLRISTSELTGKTTSSSDNSNSSVPVEYQSALTSANRYSSMLHMSQQGIYKQLTSDSDKFSAESAQYAIDNMKADWNNNALESAKDYQSQLSMSPEAIRDQLVSPDGGGFTQEQADYAVQHLND